MPSIKKNLQETQNQQDKPSKAGRQARKQQVGIQIQKAKSPEEKRKNNIMTEGVDFVPVDNYFAEK